MKLTMKPTMKPAMKPMIKPQHPRRRAALAATLAVVLAPAALQAQRRPVMRVSVLQEGVLLVDDSLVTPPMFEQKLQALKQGQGIVWLYRENPRAEPTPAVREALQRLLDSGLPISLSSRPDFSDYLDAEGRSQPRRP